MCIPLLAPVGCDNPTATTFDAITKTAESTAESTAGDSSSDDGGGGESGGPRGKRQGCDDPNLVSDAQQLEQEEIAGADAGDEYTVWQDQAGPMKLASGLAEPLAGSPLSGVLIDGQYITAPSGTVGDWSVIVSPSSMGMTEVGSEGDNALLAIVCNVTQSSDFTWRVYARYKYRVKNTADGKWYAGVANYALIPR